jgi:hypothetical protein
MDQLVSMLMVRGANAADAAVGAPAVLWDYQTARARSHACMRRAAKHDPRRQSGLHAARWRAVLLGRCLTQLRSDHPRHSSTLCPTPYLPKNKRLAR